MLGAGVVRAILLCVLTTVGICEVFHIPISTDSMVYGPFSREAVELRTATNVAMTQRADVSVGGVGIGTPKKQFQVLFSSVSPMMWVFGSGVSSTFRKDRHSLYDKKQSNTTYEDPSGTEQISFEVPYLDGGYYVGKMAYDTLRIGNRHEIEMVPFAVIDNMDSAAEEMGSEVDGIVGLGFKREPGQPSTFVEFLESSRVLNHNIFSFYFHPNGKDGQISFGDYDETRFIAPLIYINLIISRDDDGNPYYKAWRFYVDQIRVGSEVEGDTNVVAKHEIAYIDTSVDYTSAPLDVVQRIMEQSPGSYYATKHRHVFIDCSKRRTLQDLEIVIGGEYFSFGGVEYFAQQRSDGRCRLFIDGFVGGSSWTFGRKFIEKFYTVLDYDKKRIGFARTVDPTINRREKEFDDEQSYH